MNRATSRIPYAFARAQGIVVTALTDSIAEAVLHPDATATSVAEVQRLLGVPVRASRLEAGAFDELLAATYNNASTGAAELADDLAQDLDLSRLLQELPRIEDLMESQDDAPVIRLINALLTQALREGASDIHIEPFETRSVVRLRIDGTLRDLIEPAQALHGAIVSRIKIMAQLDIAEKRLPQDGRITLRVAGKPVDVRVSTVPAGHGERVVLRLLDKQAGRLNLSGLGLSARDHKVLRELIAKPHGIMLVTGPTGSGKTTSLYASLTELNDFSRNILTVEDPIEYQLDGIGQTQVNTKVDMTFARGLRAILRQDPDVVMVGEIRDRETADVAVQASLTGHLVLSTLHTNSAVGAVTRLVDMGVEPFLLSSSLIGVVAQRLVRVLCGTCREAHVADHAECELLGVSSSQPPTLFRAKGCASCNQRGYKGRTGIYEVVAVDDELRRQIHERCGEQELEITARLHGPSIRADGMSKVIAGVTTLDEVLRVTRED